MLRTRLGAMDSVGRRATEGAANDMDTSSSVSGKRTRNMDEPLASEPTEMGINGKRQRWHAPETALAADMSVVQEHAQWRNPALKPQVEAPQSSVAEGVDGAISAWVADECKRVLGPEL